MVIVVMNAAGILLVLNREKLVLSERSLWAAERRTRESLARSISELRALRGIIPICSHCREVRTELGAWQKLESYVRSNSDAQFSHGICPSCLQKHFAEYATPVE